MAKTPENIFSWRTHLRRLSPDERVRWFYEKKLVPGLSEDVLIAETARQKGNSAKVKQIYDLWTARDEVTNRVLVHDKAQHRLDHLSERPDAGRDAEWFSQLAVGLAGLGRIQQVDLNSSIPQKFTKQDVQRVRNLHTQVLDLYRQIDIDHLPPRTIHGGAIHWRGEVMQDQVRMFEKFKSTDAMAQTLIEGLLELSKNLDELAPFINTQTLLSNQPKTELQEKYIGTMYALSVGAARLARIVGKREIMIEAMRRLLSVFLAQPNVHRLTTLSSWSMKLAVEPQGGAQPLQRLYLLIIGLTGIVDALRLDRLAALQTLKSELRKWK